MLDRDKALVVGGLVGVAALGYLLMKRAQSGCHCERSGQRWSDRVVQNKKFMVSLTGGQHVAVYDPSLQWWLPNMRPKPTYTPGTIFA